MTALACLVLGQAALKPYVLVGLKVALPAAPVVLEAGAPAGTKTWVARTPGGTVFSVAVIEGGDKMPDDVAVSQFVAGFASRTESALTGERDILLNGWRGLETSLRNPKGLVWCRAYAFPGGLVGVAGAGGKASKPLVDAVLASVELDPKRGRGPYKAAGPVWTRAATGPLHTVEFPTTAADSKVEAALLGEQEGFRTTGWSASYGNRHYAAFFTEPVKRSPPPNPDKIPALIAAANTQAAASAHAKVVRRKATSVLGEPAEILEATNPDGRVTMFFQTTLPTEGILMVAAVVPTCWKGSPEVVRFLASVKPNEGKAPPDGGR